MDYHFRKMIKYKKEVEALTKTLYLLIAITITFSLLALKSATEYKALLRKFNKLNSKSVQATETVEVVNLKEIFPKEFELTGYCPCSKCNGNFPGITATGKKLEVGIVAMDKSIPFGSQIYIDGLGVFTNEDVGGAIKGNKIDIYFDTHEEALEFGRQFRNVWMLSSEVTE